MCTLAVYSRCLRDLPLVIAANRDEFYSRPTLPPTLILQSPRTVAGLDLEAGGTWLGLNEHGLAVGVLNRRNPDGPDPARASRGHLALKLLACASPHDAVGVLRGEDPARYNWFNILVASTHSAFLAGNHGDRLQVRELTAGLHLVSNLDLNDMTCPRIAKSYAWFDSIVSGNESLSTRELRTRLGTFLADHEIPLDPRLSDPLNTLCIHTPAYGTRSSTILWQDSAGLTEYWHADGPPCRTKYERVELPWMDSRP